MESRGFGLLVSLIAMKTSSRITQLESGQSARFSSDTTFPTLWENGAVHSIPYGVRSRKRLGRDPGSWKEINGP